MEKNLDGFIEHYFNNPNYEKLIKKGENLVNPNYVQKIIHTKPQEASYLPLPPDLHPNLKKYLQDQNIEKLYSHQRVSYDLRMEGKNIVITTPTASGKTFAFLLPIMQRKLESPTKTFLILYPTKALSRDQLAVMLHIKRALRKPWLINVYDGDTDIDERAKIKKAGDFILTNPDMLHSGILPNHHQWRDFFSALDTIVLDELHTYNGVFGSHMAHVINRLKRILHEYGADYRFIFSSATIKNPISLAETMTGEKFELVSESGAPESKKTYIINTVTSQTKLNAARIATIFLENNLSCIVFTTSRGETEYILQKIKDMTNPIKHSLIASYRGGYLPLERRAMEKRMREGEIKVIISTNALELGIDIGTLDGVVIVGFPRRFSSILQQFGRAGRKKGHSIGIFIPKNKPIDQYICNNAEKILFSNGDAVSIFPLNRFVLYDQLKCALFENSLKIGDPFMGIDVALFIDDLKSENLVREDGGYYLWAGKGEELYPTQNVSLRASFNKNFVITDVSNPEKPVTIGEVDYESAPLAIHDEAIYIHQNRYYYVNQLQWDQRRALVVPSPYDYYTISHPEIILYVITKEDTDYIHNFSVTNGNVLVSAMALMYKKIRIKTDENIGYGKIHLPPIEYPTMGGWISFSAKDFLGYARITIGAILESIAYLMHQLTPLITLTDQNDLGVASFSSNREFGDYSIVFYDRRAGGAGLSPMITQNIVSLIQYSIERLETCPCEDGCLECIGPDKETPRTAEEDEEDEYTHVNLKKASLEILKLSLKTE